MYPLETLLKAGIKEILIIAAPEYAGDFLRLLGSGKEFDAKFTYEIQTRQRVCQRHLLSVKILLVRIM